MPKSNSEFKIEKNVPIPADRRKKSKYPWKEMEIGDSFFVPGKGTHEFRAVPGAQKRYGMKFTMRAVEGGVRVWRVE